MQMVWKYRDRPKLRNIEKGGGCAKNPAKGFGLTYATYFPEITHAVNSSSVCTKPSTWCADHGYKKSGPVLVSTRLQRKGLKNCKLYFDIISARIG